jgi:hypothetical protein
VDVLLNGGTLPAGSDRWRAVIPRGLPLGRRAVDGSAAVECVE